MNLWKSSLAAILLVKYKSSCSKLDYTEAVSHQTSTCCCDPTASSLTSVTYPIHCEGRSELTDNTLNCVDSLYSEISALSHTTTASQACRVINNLDRLVCPSVNNRVTVTSIDQPMIRIKAQLTVVISWKSMTLLWHFVAAFQSLRWGGVFATGRKRRQRDDSVSFLVKSRLTSCHSAEASGVWRGKTGDNHRVHREDTKNVSL